MPTEPGQVTLRVRLSVNSWRRLSNRARARPKETGDYAEMVFRYLLHERTALPAEQIADPDEEKVYFSVQISGALKGRLAGWSEAERTNLASFSGRLLDGFLSRFERDPRDLAMIHHLASRLEERTVLSFEEVRQALALCEKNPQVQLPAGYLARWAHGRVKTLVRTVERDGVISEVTFGMVEEMLQSGPPGPAEGGRSRAGAS